MIIRLALLTAGLMLASAAPAQEIDAAASRISFTFRQMNVPVEGGFKSIRGRIHFDAQRPERSRAEIEVDIAGIDTGAPDGDAEAQRRAWFDSAQHPVAKFVSSGVKRLAPERYEVSGTLTIKGRAQPLTVPIEVKQINGKRHFEGGFPLRRLAFAIGEGVWADTDTVADEVRVRFLLVQRSAAKP
jgi:polyisoprenoid-binding protein YceI